MHKAEHIPCTNPVLVKSIPCNRTKRVIISSLAAGGVVVVEEDDVDEDDDPPFLPPPPPRLPPPEVTCPGRTCRKQAPSNATNEVLVKHIKPT